MPRAPRPACVCPRLPGYTSAAIERGGDGRLGNNATGATPPSTTRRRHRRTARDSPMAPAHHQRQLGNAMNRQAAGPLKVTVGRVLAASFALATLSLAGRAGGFDTTLSYGEAWRVKAPNPALIALGEGGTGYGPNQDDGDLNYKTGHAFSQALKMTNELSLKYQNYGVFARDSMLYDYAVMDQSTARTPLSPEAKHIAGEYVRLLDAFAYGKWDLGGHPLELRAGKQVIGWGESTFIQSGLTFVNPVDLSALHVPGAELKEAFLPQMMVKFTLATTRNTSLEGFYLLDFVRTEPEPDGTYFSTNDVVGAGGNKVFLNFGAFGDQGTDFRPLGGPFITNFQAIPEGPRLDPKKSGQGGLAFRWFAPGVGSGTEFGFYFMKYASRLPVVSAHAGTTTGIANAAGAATSVEAAVQALVAGATPQAAVATGAAAGLQTAQASGGTISATTLAGYATIGVNTYRNGGTTANVAAQANAVATHEYSQTETYYQEYPDDIQTLGASFNTQLGTSGIALQGELTYRHNVPLQYDDVELVFASLAPLEQALFPLSAPGVPFPTTCLAALPTITRCGQIAANGPGGAIQGWGRFDTWQFQMTATKAFAQVLGAQQFVLLAEAGITDVPHLPHKTSGGPNGQGLRLDGPGTAVSGNAALTSLQFNQLEPQSAFPTQTSWGFVALAKLDYPNLVGPWNVSPRVVFSQDVKGTSPGPGGAFIEGRYSLQAGIGADLASRWQVDVSYTQYGGAGHYNLLSDRNFVAATLKFSF